LTWLPWIGASFPIRCPDNRLLIVAESHYSNEEDPAKIAADLRGILNNRDFTREVVRDSATEREWRNKTLDAIPKLLFATPQIERQKFWNDIAFYNFVQRPMNCGTDRERPQPKEFEQGWLVFADVLRVSNPAIASLSAYQRRTVSVFSCRESRLPSQ
jgi:hypothetical protein